MASSLFFLLDDIASLLDDVATLTHLAARKTAGVLGDDLALNAQQVVGVQPNRELPVVWAVFKGSALNKVVLVPAALTISAWLPWAVTPLLMAGGLYLCFEGFEKLAHRFSHSPAERALAHEQKLQALMREDADVGALEKDKIRGAVRTDFILSAEIVTLTLGLVQGQPFATQVGVMAGVAALMTVAVYGLVAAIVKMDDVGLHLSGRTGARLGARAARGLGRGLLRAAPLLMKFLSFAGAAAMFLVGGGILVHGWPLLAHTAEGLAEGAGRWQSWAQAPATWGLQAVVGLLAGALALVMWQLVQRRLPAGDKAPNA